MAPRRGGVDGPDLVTGWLWEIREKVSVLGDREEERPFTEMMSTGGGAVLRGYCQCEGTSWRKCP